MKVTRSEVVSIKDPGAFVFDLEDANLIFRVNFILRDKSRILASVFYAKGGYKTCVFILDARELDAAGLPKILRFEVKFHEEWRKAQNEYDRLINVIQSITMKAHEWATLQTPQEQVAC